MKDSNNSFAQKNEEFKIACRIATNWFKLQNKTNIIKPTIRQASKFRNKKGIAYKVFKGLV